MLTIILGWKTQNVRTEVPEALYLGVDGVAADKAAKAACESGNYVGGRIGKLIHPMIIPQPTIPTVKPAAQTEAPAAPVEAPAAPEKTAKQTPAKKK